jgi:hypothetical protein
MMERIRCCIVYLHAEQSEGKNAVDHRGEHLAMAGGVDHGRQHTTTSSGAAHGW